MAELGPGDNCGVALLLLEDGCQQIDLADRFYAKRDYAYQSTVYAELMKRRPALRPLSLGADALGDEQFQGIRWWHGEDAVAERFFKDRKYDFIVSRAVLEHVLDPIGALEKMIEALLPGGMLLHKVDLRDHEMFSSHFHELKFFEVGERLYRRMTKASGRPNRVLIDQYRRFLSASGLGFSLLVTRLAEVGDIDPHLPYEEIPVPLRSRSLAFVRSVRSRFCAPLRRLNDEDLSISGFFLVARKAGQSQPER